MRRRYLILLVVDQTNRPRAELLPKGTIGLKNLQIFVGRLNSYGRKTYLESVNRNKSQKYAESPLA